MKVGILQIAGKIISFTQDLGQENDLAKRISKPIITDYLDSPEAQSKSKEGKKLFEDGAKSTRMSVNSEALSHMLQTGSKSSLNKSVVL
jgi:hypothetical protein